MSTRRVEWNGAKHQEAVDLLQGEGTHRRSLDSRQMMRRTIPMARRKNIALVAHDNRKQELLKWATDNLELLTDHSLYGTGTTGQLLKHKLGLNVTLLECGLLGGDQQIGSRISEGQIDFLIFFSDPLETQPHDSDVTALLRITVVWNIPVACNRASADFLISSPLMSTGYERIVPDYTNYRGRLLGDSHSDLLGAGLRVAEEQQGFASADDHSLQIMTCKQNYRF